MNMDHIPDHMTHEETIDFLLATKHSQASGMTREQLQTLIHVKFPTQESLTAGILAAKEKTAQHVRMLRTIRRLFDPLADYREGEVINTAISDPGKPADT